MVVVVRRLPTAAAAVVAAVASAVVAVAAVEAAAVAEVAASTALAVVATGSCLPINPATHFDGDHEEAAEALLVLAAEVLSIFR